MHPLVDSNAKRRGDYAIDLFDATGISSFQEVNLGGKEVMAGNLETQNTQTPCRQIL